MTIFVHNMQTGECHPYIYDNNDKNDDYDNNDGDDNNDDNDDLMGFLDTTGPLIRLTPWGEPINLDDDDDDSDNDNDDDDNNDDYDDDVFSTNVFL